MRINLISDVHLQTTGLDRVGAGADLFICLGDLVLFLDYEDPGVGIFADLFGAQNTRENFEPFINQTNADLWLSGHTHRFSRTDPKAGEHVYTQVVGGARTTTRVDVTGEQLKVAVIGQEGEEIDAITLKPR